MIKKEEKEIGGRKLTMTFQYDDNTGKLLRMLGKSIPIPQKKKEVEEITSPFLKIWEKN